MDRSRRANRNYKSSPLPTLKEGIAITENKDLLIALYGQVCTAWEDLVGVRFKLLGLVPTVSLALLATILTTKGIGEGLDLPSKLIISSLGFFSTFALYVYDHRNSVLHDDLISRGRKIEEELSIDTGIFRGRLKSECIFKHDIAINIIYYASMIAWLSSIFILIYPMMNSN